MVAMLAAADVAAPVAADAVGGAVAGGALSGAAGGFGGGFSSMIPSLISGGAGLFGNAMSQQGQQQTNAQMMAMQKDMENWMAGMSDTAMQRRVADLNAAGLNPMLAISQGGASTPGISPVQLGNPSAAYGQLGSQISSALQVGQGQAQTNAQVALNSAQTVKAQADADLATAQAGQTRGASTDEINARAVSERQQVETQKAAAQRDQASAQLDDRQRALLDDRAREIQANINTALTSQDRNRAETAWWQVHKQTEDLNGVELKYLMYPTVVSAYNSMRAGGYSNDMLQPLASFARSPMGAANPYIQQIEGMINSVGSMVSAVKGFGPAGQTPYQRTGGMTGDLYGR